MKTRFVLSMCSLMFVVGCKGRTDVTTGTSSLSPSPGTVQPNSQAPVTEIPAQAMGVATPTPAPDFTKPEAAVAKVDAIAQNLNANPSSALLEADIALLKAEGLLKNDSQIKGWVK